MHGWYPDLDQLRNQAKRLLRQAKEGDQHALRLFPRTDRAPQLADAQYAVAKVVGFASWRALVRAVESSLGVWAPNELRTRLILVRGGRGDAEGRFYEHGGPGLDDVGRAQAERVATRLAEILAVDRVAPVISSRRPRSIETAEVIASALGVPVGEPTCELCQMHPGLAEGLTQEQMSERFGPNYAFVPGAESWPEFVVRATEALPAIARRHRGRTVIAVTESAVMKASFMAFGGMPIPAAEVIMTEEGSITDWSCLVEGDIRRVGTWRLERYNETAGPVAS
jgi:broad specificity phosphatase PhoE